ncbi:MAG: FkbM family methyltransferase [Legionellales bacterium]|nr:FkbM family methyltransferase [Legionellales bacterium]
MKRYIAIDLDGTVLDSRERHKIVLQNCLAKRKLSFPLEDLLVFKSTGKNNIIYLKKYITDDKLINEIQEDWIENIEKKDYLEKDILYSDTRFFLKKASLKFNLILITARSNKENAYWQISDLNIAKYFKFCIVVPTGKDASKLKAKELKKFKIDYLIGDTEVDEFAAKDLGVKFVALNSGFRSKEFWDSKNVSSYNNLSAVFNRILSGDGASLEFHISMWKDKLKKECEFIQDDKNYILTPLGIKLLDIRGELYEVIHEIFITKIYDFFCQKQCVLMDIGANVGAASLYLSKNNANIKKIYAYEPFQETYKIAQENFKLNPQESEKIEFFNFGLDRQNEFRQLPYNREFSSSMTTYSNEINKYWYETVQTNIELRQASKEVKKIYNSHKELSLVLKCDIQGTEFDLFEELDQNDALELVDIILLETHKYYPAKIINILKKHNFSVFVQVTNTQYMICMLYAVRLIPPISKDNGDNS